MRTSKVIFIANGVFPYAVGGIQRHTRLLIEKLATHYPLHIYLIHTHPQKIFSNFPNITEIHIEGVDKSKIYLFELYRFSKRVYSEVSKLGHDLPIYCQGLSVFYNISRFGSRVIFNPHGLEPFQATPLWEYLRLTPFRVYTKIIMHYSGSVISLGGKLSDIIRKNVWNDKKVVTIPNAINLPKENYADSKFQTPRLNCLFISRFAYNKGIDVLMETIKQVNEAGYEDRIQFNLGGTGPLYDHFVNTYKFSNVRFLGFIKDDELSELYRSNDLFVFPTQFEGMPTVVLEAMSYALPIIVTDVGATSELVCNRNGVLLKKKRDSQEIKEAILWFYNLDRAKKRAMAINSYNKVAMRFTWDRVALDTYSHLTRGII